MTAGDRSSGDGGSTGGEGGAREDRAGGSRFATAVAIGRGAVGEVFESELGGPGAAAARARAEADLARIAEMDGAAGEPIATEARH